MKDNRDNKDFEKIKNQYEEAIEKYNQKREQLEVIRKEMLFILEDIKKIQATMKAQVLSHENFNIDVIDGEIIE